jgi:hypothetical protein
VKVVSKTQKKKKKLLEKEYLASLFSQSVLQLLPQGAIFEFLVSSRAKRLKLALTADECGFAPPPPPPPPAKCAKRFPKRETLVRA